MQATLLLQAALSLLVALASLGTNVSPSLRQQVITVANEAITQANYEIANPPMTDTGTETTPVPDQTPTPGASSPAQGQVQAPAAAPQEQDAPATQAAIQIVTMDNVHQLTDTWQVAPASVTTAGEASSTNYVAILGAIVTDASGNVDKTATMTVTTDDEAQNTTIVGTGNFWGAPHNVYYYPYTYLFRTAGEHQITFTANGVSASVTLNSQ